MLFQWEQYANTLRQQCTLDYSKNNNTGASQNMGVQDVMLFKPFDWIMVSMYSI